MDKAMAGSQAGQKTREVQEADSQQSAYEKLPPQRRKFVDEYLLDFNATKAAERAKYKQPMQQGSRLLSFVEIKAAIKERMAASVMDTDEVLYHLAQIARGDLADLLDDKGRPNIGIAKAAGKSNLIKKLKTRTVVSTKGEDEGEADVEVFEDTIESYDRIRALELIGKALGIFTEKVDLTSGGKPLVISVTKMDVDEL